MTFYLILLAGLVGSTAVLATTTEPELLKDQVVEVAAPALPSEGIVGNKEFNKAIAAGYRQFRIYDDIDSQVHCLALINRKRARHERTPRLVLGRNFTRYTVDRAHDILRDIESRRDISKGEYPFGESFFWYYDPRRYRTTNEAIQTWYDESRNYDYNRPGFSSKTGGFTQLVWRGSREASCVRIEYESGNHYKTLLVANFWPAGNVRGEFPFNVMPPKRLGDDDYVDDDEREEDYRPPRPTPRPPRPVPTRPPRPLPPTRPPRPDYPDYPERPDYYPPAPYPPRPRPPRPDYDLRVNYRPLSDFLGPIDASTWVLPSVNIDDPIIN